MKTNLHLGALLLMGICATATVQAEEPEFFTMIKGAGTQVTDASSFKDGGIYLIYDSYTDTNNGDRRALRCNTAIGGYIYGSHITEPASWTITTDENGKVTDAIAPNYFGWVFGKNADTESFSVRNLGSNGYIPSVTANTGNITAATDPTYHTFTWVEDHFSCHDANTYAWDGNPDPYRMALWGAASDGHPYQFYEALTGLGFTYNGTTYDVTEESRQTLVKERYSYAQQIPSLLTQAQEIRNQIYLRTDKLLTASSQITSDNSDSSEGTNTGNLIDDNTSTIWHSDWHGTADACYHNLMFTFENTQNSTTFVFSYVGRQNNTTNRPSIIYVYGGTKDDDGNITWSETYTELTTADGLAQASADVTFTMDQAYDALKFEVREIDSTSGKTGGSNVTHPCFNYSEVQLYGQYRNPDMSDVTDEMVSTLDSAISGAQAANADIVANDTKAAYEALKAAVDTITGQSDILKKVLEAAIAEAEEAFPTIFKDNIPGYESTTSEYAVAYKAAIEVAKAVNSDYDTAADALREALAAATPTHSGTTAPHGKVFTISSSTGRGTLWYNAESDFIWSTGKTACSEESLKEWMTYVDGDYTFIYCPNNGKFIYSTASGSFGDTWGYTANPTSIEILDAADSQYGTGSGFSYGNVVLRSAGNYMSVSNSYNGPIITYFAVNDGGVPMTFSPVRDATDDEIAAAKLIVDNYLASVKAEVENEIGAIKDDLETKDAKAEVGYYTEEAIKALEDAIAQINADETLNNTAKAESIQALYNAFTTDPANRQQPKQGFVYTLVSVHPDHVKYIVHNGTTVEAMTQATFDELDAPNAANWYCEWDETAGTFSLTGYSPVETTTEETDAQRAPEVAGTVATTFTATDGTNTSTALVFRADNAPDGTFNIWSDAVQRYVVLSNDESTTAINRTTNLFASSSYEGRFRLTTVGDDIQAATTRLSELTAESTAATDATCYDLQGRRINRPTTPGLYIIGGKLIRK
jgi:hypothetical protein